jgi:hypothetical protein
MGKFVNPLTILFAAATVVGAVAGSLAIAALGMVLLLGSLAMIAHNQVRKQWRDNYEDDLSHEARALLRPINRLRVELEELVEAHRQSPAMTVIGDEAVREARRITDQAARMLQFRSELRKIMRGRYEAEKAITELDRQVETAATEDERKALESAREARRLELQHYEQQDRALSQIDSGLKQAEAALSEMKARLAISVTSGTEMSDGSPLNEMVLRLKTLGQSFEEAEEFLRESAR